LLRVLSQFVNATKLVERPDGRFVGEFDRSWWVVVGPNGGVIAALLLRAAQLRAGDDRTARTITIHYVRPPAEGEVEMEVSVDQAGRTVSFLTVRMFQNDRLVATALVALTTARENPVEWEQRKPPASLPIESGFMMGGEGIGVDVPIRQRWDQAWTIGVPGHPETFTVDGFEAGGWIRLVDPAPYDAPLIAAMADAWVPAVMVHDEAPVHTPTLELTIHFRLDVEHADLDPEEHCLAVFRQLSAHQGFLDESGEIWTADGRLLAMCRQMGLVLPRPETFDGPKRVFRPRSSVPGR
jgi:acyl-CoA thioesterase